MASAKGRKKEQLDTPKNTTLVFEVDPTECPFREFKDGELNADLWGLGPAACRATVLQGKATKPSLDVIWMDEQTQPLPRSVRQYLHGWVRAEELASDRWGAEIVVFEESDSSGKMSVMDTQLSHAQVLVRSSFCKRVLSACFMLERAEGLTTEHQWEHFMCATPEGWRPRYHIYSPGMKPGGGTQHRPTISKSGCYLVRLFYLGAWRCVWVNDLIPVDATDAPLLPFSPLLHTQPSKQGIKSAPTMVYSSNVHLWPMLMCKALLKLASPYMNSDEDTDCVEDELMTSFNIMHALTGCMELTYVHFDQEILWKMLTTEIPVFIWDDDDVTATSTAKSKPKKPNTKEAKEDRNRSTMATILIEDTKDAAPYLLPGITPAHEMSLLLYMVRDLPLKKPLPEPDVALWKNYRWVDWAKRHGLYEAYECPRTKFLKVTGLMKLSYAPHLLDVKSTESITFGYRQEHERTTPVSKKGGKGGDAAVQGTTKQTNTSANQLLAIKEELREWVQFISIYDLIIKLNIIYFPSMYEYTSAASSPPVRITKTAPNRALDMVAPKCAPLYLQIDGPEQNNLKLALNVLHPRVMINSGIPIYEYIEPAYFILEEFKWFVDCELPIAKGFVQTSGYDSIEVTFQPGRHYCRLWVHSRLNWHIMLLSQSTLLLGPREIVQAAAVHECPWAVKFLGNLSNAFAAWIRNNRSNLGILSIDREFYKSYKPDLEWNRDLVGYDQNLLHWMFRQALQSHFRKRLPSYDYLAVCKVLRHYFCDPDFGLPPKPLPSRSLREMIALDPCDCLIPEAEEEIEQLVEEQAETEEKPIVSPELMLKLLDEPILPTFSQICNFATEELPCGILKEEREKVIKKHEAATLLQAHWRGARTRMCMNVKMTFTPDVLKLVMENAFGNPEALSALMNEFFEMYPGAKSAYSVASALSGLTGLIQHAGTTNVTAKCKWIPYFQGVFFCHAPVKAHFTVCSTIPYSTVLVYNNDTGMPMPQAYNAHVTYDISPNINGYTVMGHGTLNEAKGVPFEAHWQLTILSSYEGHFHVCDNDIDRCVEQTIPNSQKLHIDEMFIPNRRNILGGLLVSVTKHEAITFRAAASSPELDLVATLRAVSLDGSTQELATCFGKGEVYWQYISLHPHPVDTSLNKNKSVSLAHMGDSTATSNRSMPKPKKPLVVATAKKSLTKVKTVTEQKTKVYSIQVTAPAGWPLTIDQWKRVDERRNTDAEKRSENREATKKSAKGGKKDFASTSMTATGSHIPYTPQIDDAYVELECSLAIGGGASARRDDTRDLEFAAARKQWEALEAGRNLRGAALRDEFRAEFLVALPPPKTDSMLTTEEESIGEEMEIDEGAKKMQGGVQQGPTPVTESGMLEISLEMEEESKYLLMPEQLREKFISLNFLSLCTKEKNEEDVILLSSDMAEAAKQDLHARIEASLERMKELQAYNEEHMLERQRNRCRLLEYLSVDATWCQQLADILEIRDDAIAQEQLMRNQSAIKKKQDQKDQKGVQTQKGGQKKGKK